MVSEQKSEGFDGAFVVVQSNGGGLDFEYAKDQCVRILESGPAAGVIGAEALCGVLGIGSAVAFDMGGTTAKAAVIQAGRAVVSGNAIIGRRGASLPIQIPMINISEVGTGGGSIARIVDGNSLRVGPLSAGAVPGPVCYGAGGTEPTVTDANLILGRLDPKQFLGGEMGLDVDAAATALRETIADPLALDLTTAASGILQIAVTAMSHAVKAVTVERGLDVRDFDLIAYGGAGPLHATLIAHELKMKRVVVPRAPGHFSAVGMLLSDLRYDRVQTIFRRLASLTPSELVAFFESLERSARHELARAKARPKEVRTLRSADMRYVGQEHTVTVDLPEFDGDWVGAIKRIFDSVHNERYGHFAPGEEVEVVSLRSMVFGSLDKPPFEKLEKGGEEPCATARRSDRDVYLIEPAQPTLCRVFDRERLRAGNKVRGPALIEEAASTSLVLPADTATVDPYGNLIIGIGE
jgi:N-methylhydantoinase A